MKIIRIIARLNVGGPARHVVWLTEALNDGEFKTTLLAGSVPPGEDDMGYFAAEKGVEPVYIPEMSREISFSDLRSLFKIYRALKRERPDIVHTHTAKAGTLGRSAALLYKWLTPATLLGRPRQVKVVHTFHGHVFHSYYSRSKTRIFIAIERLLARVATDRIIVLSEQQRQEINEKFGIGRPYQFSIIPLGIDVGKLATVDDSTRIQSRKSLSAGDREFAVGYVGRLTEIKNLPLLLESAALLGRSEAVKFYIVGNGNLRNELEFQADSLGLKDKISFLGARSDIADIYHAMDVVVITSFNEGTPLSLIEAMAAGKAVISTGVGGVRDLLGETRKQMDGFAICERGVRVDTFQPKDLANGLQYLIDNETVCLDLARAGKEYALAKYSKERLVSDIKVLYRGLADG